MERASIYVNFFVERIR